LDIFQQNLAHSVDGHEKIITWKFLWNPSRTKLTVESQYCHKFVFIYGKFIGKRDNTTKRFIFAKHVQELDIFDCRKN
jgi:hypothetical protein